MKIHAFPTLIAATALIGAVATAAAAAQQSGSGETAPTSTASTTAESPASSPRDFSGIWMIRYRAFRYTPSPMTPWAEALMKSRTPDQDPGATCLSPGIARQMGAPYPTEIVMTPEVIYTLHEYQHEIRRIFMNATHPAELEPTLMGHSTGRWDGNTLVVDTIGLDDVTWLSPAGHPHSEALHVVERFTKSPDGKVLEIETTFIDPKAYIAPWTTSNTYDARNDLDVLEYICQENNRDAPHRE